MKKKYRHTQISWIGIIITLIIIAITIPFIFIGKLVLYFTLGSSFLLFLLFLLFGTLTVTVTEEYLKFFFGIGLICKRIKLTSINGYREVKNSWLCRLGD